MDVASAASVAHEVWAYNRDNYMSDRDMRQEQEFTTMDFRIKQAELWREDVRDLIALTQRKMSSYLIILALSLKFCITMFTEGRLEPGTPRWLLRLYMLSLGAAFIYMLLAMWLAMHASVVARSVETRLLTQLVRLPIPSWQQLEACRTYGVSFETLPLRGMLRVPFLQTLHEDMVDSKKSQAQARQARQGPPSPARLRRRLSGSASPRKRLDFVDPWKLERDASEDIYELQQLPPAELRHTKLVRRAAVYYQCYDAFARVCLAFGMNQLLHALGYFVYGYLLIQNGAPFAAAGVTVVALVSAVVLVELDWSLTSFEMKGALTLAIVPPLCSGIAALEAAMKGYNEMWISYIVLPFAFLAHSLWFVWALAASGVSRQPDGAMLPMKFRAVLYLDVFGWFYHREADAEGKEGTSVEDCYDKLQELKAEMAMWTSPHVEQACSAGDLQRIDACRQELAAMEEELRLAVGHVPSFSPVVMSEESNRWLEISSQDGFQYFLDPDTGDRRQGTWGQVRQFLAWQPVSSLQDLEDHIHELYEALMDLMTSGETSAAEGAEESQRESHGSSSPRHLLRTDSVDTVDETANAATVRRRRRAPRREDSSRVSSASESSPSRAKSKRQRLAEYFNLAGSVKGVGDEDVLAADVRSFDPVTFYPYGRVGAREDLVGDGEEIVTGHDHWKPGRVPEKLFRGVTLLMAALWAIALLLSFDIYFGKVSFRTENLPEAAEASIEQSEHNATDEEADALLEDEEPYGESGADSGILDTGRRVYSQLLPHVRPVPGAVQVPLVFPHQLPSWPRLVSCDASGGRVVLADDVVALIGALAAVEPPSATLRPLELEPFPSCLALEGQGLRDVALTCNSSSTASTLPSESCHLLALSTAGEAIVDCPFPAGSRREATKVIDGRSWFVSHRWLDDTAVDERLWSLAAADVAAPQGSRHPRLKVLASTTAGRLVELRQARGLGAEELVPQRLLQRWQWTPSDPGALAVFQDTRGHTIVAKLLSERGTVHLSTSSFHEAAFGFEMRLPDGVRWLAICASRSHLFALGARARGGASKPELWRFLLPSLDQW